MKTLHELAAELRETDWQEPRGLVATVHAETRPGRFVQIGLGELGVVVFHGTAKVGIPLAEIIALAVRSEPALDPVQISLDEEEAALAAAAVRQAQEAAATQAKRQAIREEKLRRQEAALAAPSAPEVPAPSPVAPPTSSPA